MKPGELKHDRSSAIIKAAVEAGQIRNDELTIVIVVDKTATIDISSCAPDARAAALLPETLILALAAVQGHSPDLTDRIEVGKA